MAVVSKNGGRSRPDEEKTRRIRREIRNAGRQERKGDQIDGDSHVQAQIIITALTLKEKQQRPGEASIDSLAACMDCDAEAVREHCLSEVQ
jgi:hypothetical protein